MFVQVIRGRVSDPEQVHAALDRWHGQLAAGAQGWLGTTAGVAADDRFVAMARFESEETARRNSDRPEQGQWWAETSKLFTGDVTFRNSSDVTAEVRGDPDKAGFVQVMEGRASDLKRALELMAQNPDEIAAARPDVIGNMTVAHGGGAFTVAFYFTSEEAAREGERKELPPHLKAQMEELFALNVGEPEWLDLRQPWLYSP